MNDEIKSDLRKNFPDKLGDSKFEVVQVNEVPLAGEWLGFWMGSWAWMKRTVVGLVVFLMAVVDVYDHRELLIKPVTHLGKSIAAEFCYGERAPASLDLWHSLPPQPVSAFPDPRVAITNGCAVYLANSNSNVVVLSAGTNSGMMGRPVYL